MFPSQSDSNLYLQQEVLTATPIRLRWMLIRRAEELCGIVGQLWQAGDTQQASQWLLRIREILGELLAGVTDGEDSLRKTIADFYVFLLQQVNEIEQTRSHDGLARLRELLSIELETWTIVVEKHSSSAGSTAAVLAATATETSGSLSLDA